MKRMAREKMATAAIITCMVAAMSMLPALIIDGNTQISVDVGSRIHVSEASISHPPDMTCIELTTGNVFSWTINGAWVAGNYYAIYLDDAQIGSGSWYNGTTITVNVDGLSKGEHRYKLVVDDGFSGISQDEVVVTITENQTLNNTILVSVIISITLLVIFGTRRYQKSPAGMARKARRVEALEREKQAALKAEYDAQNAKDELERRSREIKERLARLERERAEQAEREKQAAEEAKMRELFKKFMAEEQGKVVDDVDKMFGDWKNKKGKI